MRIAMIGSGYVGLVSGACFAQFGHDVVCIDKEEGKIARLRKGEMPIYEPGLDKLVADNVKAGRLSFTTRLGDAVGNADAVFIAVGTPTRRGDGHADLTYVYAAAAEVADAIRGYTVVVTKSTVPVGTGREVARIIRETQPSAEFDVCSNPEFLREGAAIEDFMKPDRVVIGVESQRARDVMAGVYRPLNLIQTPMVFTNIETAEVTKYAGNAFLATKITFINEIADLCEKVGADVHDVARGIGLDGRIGRKFLHPGPGFGGSCFPKDTLALAYTAREVNAPQTIVEQVIEVNNTRKKRMAAQGHRLLRRLGGGADRRRARAHLQAQHRRHARRALARHRAGAAVGRGEDRRLRSRGHGGGRQHAAGHHLRQDRLRGGIRGGRPGRDHRVARVPRPRSAPYQAGDAPAAHRRPAQHLQSRGDARSGLHL